MSTRSAFSRWSTPVLAGLLSLGSLSLAAGAQQRWNDPDWHGPNGYNDAYPENGTPNAGARQGYAAGYEQGQSDIQHHHSFRPTQVDTYKHVPESPGGVNRDQFKNTYRQAFVRGYSKGYGR